VGANGQVNFSSTSTGTGTNTSYFWNFGDGFISNAGPNVSHTYASAGAFQVWLNVNSGSCADSTGASVNVTGIPCVANSNFTVFPTGTPQFWGAAPNYPWNVTNATWSWGDGSSTNALYTSHTYSTAGTYSICLTVTVNCGGVSTTCISQFINKTTGANNLMVHIQVVPPQNVTVGIRDNESDNLIYNIYPNPNNGDFSVKMQGLNDGISFIGLFNVMGQMIYTTSAEIVNGELNKEVALSQISNGIYFLKVNAGNKTYTKKVVISR
jgi:hypothetical protein